MQHEVSVACSASEHGAPFDLVQTEKCLQKQCLNAWKARKALKIDNHAAAALSSSKVKLWSKSVLPRSLSLSCIFL